MRLRANIFPNETGRIVPNNIPRNPPLCSFVSLSSVFYKWEMFKRLNYFMISPISPFDIINIVVPEPELTPPRSFSWISASDAAAVNPNGINTVLASGVNTFFTNGKSTFINGLKTLECRVFDNVLIVEEHCVKPVRIRSYSDPHFSRISPHLNLIRRVILVPIFPHFPAVGLNTERHSVLPVFNSNAGKSGKNVDQNNFEYGHFLRSGNDCKNLAKTWNLSVS